jgi:hypothetical protein
VAVVGLSISADAVTPDGRGVAAFKVCEENKSGRANVSNAAHFALVKNGNVVIRYSCFIIYRKNGQNSVHGAKLLLLFETDDFSRYEFKKNRYL